MGSMILYGSNDRDCRGLIQEFNMHRKAKVLKVVLLSCRVW